MAKAVRITPEQYLALGDLGVPVYANHRSMFDKQTIATILMSGGDTTDDHSCRLAWAKRSYWSFWTLVDG